MHAQCGATAPSTPGASGPLHTRNFSVRYRHSALSTGQQRSWERLWPQLGLDITGITPGDRLQPLDSRAWFHREAPVVLEIGCGSGTSTLAMAKAEPDIDVIAVEVYQRGLVQLLCAIERDGVTNIRMVRGDAFDVLDQLAGPESLIGVRVFFPDPWPKARHHKRRFLQPATMTLIADRLRPDGVLHAATDHADYAMQIAESGDAESRLRRVADPSNPSTSAGLPISVARPTTKYEAKGRDAGSVINEFVWQRHR